MDLSKALASAVERAAVKRSVAATLTKLSPGDRRGVLLELLAEEDVSTVASTPRPPNGRAVHVEKRAPKAAPPEQGNGGGPTAMVLAALREQPMRAIELATKLFGPNPDRKAQSRVRSVLWALNKQERVKAIGKGRWAAAET